MAIKNNTGTRGFTIVELIIVIVVIGILFSLIFVAYQGVQENARRTKIRNDVSEIENAIRLARNKTHKTLPQLTGAFDTAQSCIDVPSGYDLSLHDATTASCWSDYQHAMDAVSQASGSNVSNLTDPWNRPYLIDENELEYQYGGPYAGKNTCYWDTISVYSHPYVHDGWNDSGYVIPNVNYGNDLEPSGYTVCSSKENGGTGGV